MKTEQKRSEMRALGFVAMLAVGVMLGAAVPVLAESEAATTSAACSAGEISSPAGSEWALPPTGEGPGGPF